MNAQSPATVIDSRTNAASAYDAGKLVLSIRHACHSVGIGDGAARDTAAQVEQAVAKWISNKTEVTSNDIRHVAGTKLQTLAPEAGYLYQHEHTIM